MRTAVIVFPGSNCDRDAAVALEHVTGRPAAIVWHREAELPPLDLIFLPGGFSFGDYLRCGAIAAHSPVMREVVAAANKGVVVLGVCNGFHLLTEVGLLPGALIKNAGLKFVCHRVRLRVEQADTLFAAHYAKGQQLQIPVAHGDGNYRCDENTLARLEGEGRIAFRYAPGENPNGSLADIAGIYDENGRVLGMMPHPERAIGEELGSADGLGVFRSLVEGLA